MRNSLDKKKLLVLLTNYFPYYKGEEYIENEILYLSKKFDRIIIIATMITEGSKQTRQVPENVSVYFSGISHSKSGKAKMLLKHGLKANKIRLSHSEPSEYKKLIHKVYATYFEARFMTIYPKVTKILDKENALDYQKIKVYSYWLYMTARLAVELKEKYFASRNVYTFSRAHGYDVNEAAAPLNYLPFRPFLLQRLDSIFPVTNQQVETLQAKYTRSASRIELRKLGTIGCETEKTLRSRSMNPFLLVSCSSIKKVKRINLIIEALAKLSEDHPDLNYKWIHFGDGPESNTMKKMASQLLSPERYEFRGHIPNNELHDWYQDNQPAAFINASSSEGVPVSIMEACSYGIPIIATDVGGTRDVVHDDKNGFLLPENVTIIELSRVIGEILKMDEVKYKDFSLSSFEIWNQSYNAEKVYEEFADEISER